MARRKSISIGFNIDELYVLSKRILWYIQKLHSLSGYARENKRSFEKSVKSYLSLLRKIIGHSDLSKPLYSEITINFTASEVGLLWTVVNKINRTHELLTVDISNEDKMSCLLSNIESGKIKYKDLTYWERVYVFLYTEIAHGIYRSTGHYISVNPYLFTIRNTYTYEYLSDYRCIYELQEVCFDEMYEIFYILEPRYSNLRYESVKLTPNYELNCFALYNLKEKDFNKAQELMINSYLDYEYIESKENEDDYDIYDDELSTLRDQTEVNLNEANDILRHKDYGPGWRLSLFFNLDEDEMTDEVPNKEAEVIERLREFEFLNLDKSILTKGALDESVQSKNELFEEIRSKCKLFCRIYDKQRAGVLI